MLVNLCLIFDWMNSAKWDYIYLGDRIIKINSACAKYYCESVFGTVHLTASFDIKFFNSKFTIIISRILYPNYQLQGHG